jgi:hypothetical protein
VRASGGQLLDPYDLLDEDGHLIAEYCQDDFDENDYHNPNKDVAQRALQYGMASNMAVGSSTPLPWSLQQAHEISVFRSAQQAHESYVLLPDHA